MMNPNPNFSTDFGGEVQFNFEPSFMELDLSDYLMQGSNFNQEEYSPSAQSVISSEKCLVGGSSTISRSNNNIKCKKNGEKRSKMEVGHRVAFRTESERDVMDDGFKWRKYGKKSVKNSPNPRNYYKCSNGGCNVKKRIERDRNDSSYVITTYEGVHNHECPGVVYCDQISINATVLQASYLSSS